MESFDLLRRRLLIKVAELTERYGLTPGDYVVDIRLEPGPQGTFGLESWPAGPMSLTLTVGPADPVKAGRYRALLETLGVLPASGSLVGEYTALHHALDRALQVVPPQ